MSFLTFRYCRLQTLTVHIMPTLLDSHLSGLQPSILGKNFLNALKLMLIAFTTSAFFSCENYRPAEPVVTQYVKVTNVNRDTVIGIPNENLATSARISFTETLSDTALVRISVDTLFSKNGSVFLLPITNPPMMSIGGLSGDSLFIQYQRYKKPISGDLTIEITFQ
jgi:hypothetical protein